MSKALRAQRTVVPFIAWITLSAVPAGSKAPTTKACLSKIGQIKEVFSSGRLQTFKFITGLCCDSEGNLFIADSGHNKIFKFDDKGQSIAVIGETGQDRGEFLASPQAGLYLKISCGNDNQIYVTDPGNRRLIRLSNQATFLDYLMILRSMRDAATVNSKGNIYMLSRSGTKVIDCLDRNLKFQTSLLEIESHLFFPYGRPPFPLIDLRTPNDLEVLKMISTQDNLVVISNYALKAFVFDQQNKLICSFSIDRPEFIEDFKKRLSNIKREDQSYLPKKEGLTHRGSFILPFTAMMDEKDNLDVLYKMGGSDAELYRYRLDGTFLGKWKFPDKIDGLNCCTDRQGRIFVSCNQKTEIAVYETESK
jgi:hypothetical protein